MRMIDWDEAWGEESDKRNKIDVETICSFGIEPLDNALIGILKNDLVVIGADSGAGKSSLCLDIALHNASKGKKVALYFIEGGEQEAMARIKWKAMTKKYYANKEHYIDMDYRKWRMNMIRDPLIKKLENEVFFELKEKIKDNLQLYQLENTFTIQNLINSLGYYMIDKFGEKMQLGVDLIIIDHLQYFTLTNPKNELSEMTQILMEVNKIVQFYNTPVVLVSHLRKKDKDRGLPGQEDFYGTSNIAKISSVSITISSKPNSADHARGIYPTFFRFVKSRTGLRDDVVALCDYSLKAGEYSKNYGMVKLIADKPCAEQMRIEQWPLWAKNQPKKPMSAIGDWNE